MGDVETPRDRPLDLGAQLAEHLGMVGVLPQVFERAGKAALAGLQRRGVRDRAPAVGLVLGVEREVDAEIIRRECHLAASRAHGAGTMIEAHVAAPSRMRTEHADVGGVTRAEVVARQDDQASVGCVSEPFGEGDLRSHGGDATGGSSASL